MSVTTFISSLLPPISSSLNNTLTPHEPHYPIYHTRENSILPFMTDKFLSLLIPIVAYWVFSLLFHALDCLELPYFEKMRIHESEEVQSRNRVTVWGVIKAVLLQQFFQTALGWVWLESEQEILEREIWRDHTADMQKLAGVVGQGLHLLLGGKTAGTVAQALGGGNLTAWVYWWGVPIVQMVFAL
jgi:sphinganine C4-monooxygenase